MTTVWHVGIDWVFTLRYTEVTFLLPMIDRPLVELPLKNKKDCSVIATMAAFGISYEEALTLLGATRSPDTHLVKKWNELAESRGELISKHSFPAVKRKKRMNVIDFCKSHPTGRFILRQAGHVAAVIDGKLHETPPVAWWHWERCVYTAFEIKAL